MHGGPALTRPLGRTTGVSAEVGKVAADAAVGVVSVRPWRGIRTDTTAAMTAERAPPITTN